VSLYVEDSLASFNLESRGGNPNVPRFLDFELDEQKRASLLQACMCSHRQSFADDEAGQSRSTHLQGHPFTTSVSLTCTSGSETPVTIESTNLIFGGVQTYFFDQATASVTSALLYPDDVRPLPILSEPEAESGFIENERVITFRKSSPDFRRPHQLTNLSISPEAARFAASARGRRLRGYWEHKGMWRRFARFGE
jgi:hypothetical protein